MATKGKQQEKDRRARVEAMRRAEKARERRRNLIFIGVAVVVGLTLIGLAAVPALRGSGGSKAALATLGVSNSAASCGPVQTDPAVGNNDHKPDGTTLKYAEVPPSSGPHWGDWVFPSRGFYTDRDRPRTEQLVHNLEHGYTVLWYDSTIRGDKLDVLRNLATAARADKATGGKFIVSAWDDAYGKFPAGKHIALSHWGAKEGYRQLCGGISGASVKKFITDYPAADSPEPNAT